MRRFDYLRDPLFLLSVTVYAVNRFALAQLLSWSFLHNHLDDLLLIPAALPVALWVQRLLGVRPHDSWPRWSEMLLHLGVWSVICEYIGPFWLHIGVADWGDVAAYVVGGLVACLWWRYAAAKPVLAR